MPKTAAERDWSRVAFGDVVAQVRDRVHPDTSGVDRYVAGEHMDTDDLRIRRWGSIGDGYLGPAFHMRFKPGHVLYGSRRTYLRKVAIAEFEGITANTTFVLEPKDPNVLLPGLLPFIMQTEAFHEHSIKQSKGSVNPYVSFSDLAWFEFALPPLQEQDRLVKVLAAVESVLEKATALRSLAEAAFRLVGTASLVADAVADMPVWRDSSWRSRPLGEIITPGRSLSYGILKPGLHVPDGIPMFRVENVDGLGFRTNERVLRVSAAIEATKKGTRLRGGEVLISVVASIGRIFRVTSDMRGWNVSRAWAVIPAEEAVDPAFLEAYLQSSFAQSFFRRRMTGSAQAVLNLGELKQLAVPLPDHEEQLAIAERIEVARSSIPAISARRVQALSVKKALINGFSR